MLSYLQVPQLKKSEAANRNHSAFNSAARYRKLQMDQLFQMAFPANMPIYLHEN